MRRGAASRRENYERFTAGLTPDLHIMDLLDAQPEFTKAPWDYLDLLVSDDRIAHGRALLDAIRADLRRGAAHLRRRPQPSSPRSGASNPITARSAARVPVIRSTATLACVGRRRDYFREEFLSTLEILQRGDVPPEHLIGSWAGAFGPTQFMPTSFKRYAVDFDGDGHRDVVDSVPDVIASTANNLKMDGWVSGETWGYEVVLPQNFDYLLADSPQADDRAPVARSRRSPRQQQRVSAPRRSRLSAVPAGARGPAFLMLQNFRVIMKYNPAEAYALAIGYLADRMRGGAPFVQSWPRDERVLTTDERYEMQQLLARARLQYRPARRARWARRPASPSAAIRSSIGQVPDGFASSEVLDRLRQQ